MNERTDSSNRRRPRAAAPASWLLAVGLAVGLAAFVRADTESQEFRLDPCPAPLRVSFFGLPVPPERSEVVTCGTERERHFLEFDDPARDLGPVLSLQTRESGALDLRVTLREPGKPRVYEAKNVAPGAERHVLARIDHADGPELAVSIERLEGEPYVGLFGDVLLQQVVSEIARVKGLEVKGIDRLPPEEGVSFTVSAARVSDVLFSLATGAGLTLRGDAEAGFELGVVKDAEAIAEQVAIAEKYRASEDRANLRLVLERIVELAKPNDADDFETFVPAELEELAGFAIAEGDYLRAEALRREILAQFERMGYGDSEYYALTLTDLASVRARLGDSSGATELGERALAMLERHPDGPVGVRARVASALARLAFEAGRVDQAVALNLRAFIILEGQGEEEFQALDETGDLESELAAYHEARNDHAAAQAHYERKHTLFGQWFGADDQMLDYSRASLIHNALTQGKGELAVSYLEEQIALSEQRPEPASWGYAEALTTLTALRVAEDRLDEAISLWERMVRLRSDVLGAEHPLVVAAIGDLATLQSIHRLDEEAAANRVRAAAIKPLVDQQRVEAVEDGLRMSLGEDLGRRLQHDADTFLARQRQERTADDRQLATVHDRLGELLAGDWTRLAVDHFEQALVLRLAAQGPDHADTKRTTARLTSLYEASQDQAGVERVRARLRPPLTAAQRRLTTELLRVMELEQQLTATVPLIVDLQIQQNPHLDRFREVLLDFSRSAMAWEAVEPRLVDLYAGKFSEVEMRKMIEFYQTPTGKRVLAETPDLTRQGAAIGIGLVQARLPELVAMIRAREAELDENAE